MHLWGASAPLPPSPLKTQKPSPQHKKRGQHGTAKLARAGTLPTALVTPPAAQPAPGHMPPGLHPGGLIALGSKARAAGSGGASVRSVEAGQQLAAVDTPKRPGAPAQQQQQGGGKHGLSSASQSPAKRQRTGGGSSTAFPRPTPLLVLSHSVSHAHTPASAAGTARTAPSAPSPRRHAPTAAATSAAACEVEAALQRYAASQAWYAERRREQQHLNHTHTLAAPAVRTAQAVEVPWTTPQLDPAVAEVEGRVGVGRGEESTEATLARPSPGSQPPGGCPPFQPLSTHTHKG